jgi:hypothetical protein
MPVSSNRLICLLACLLCLGCGRKAAIEVVPITGTVTWHGTPVPDLFVNFEPAKGRPSWAMTDAQGKYETHYTPDQPGVLAGECRVWMTIKPKSPQEEQQMVKGTYGRMQELKPLLSKYGRTSSPLTFIISSKNTEIDLALD